MTWDAIGAMAESAAAIAVLASLIYLGIQIKKDTAATLANTTQMRASAARESMLAVATTPELASALARTSMKNASGIERVMELSDLDQVEATMLHFYWLSIARSADANLRVEMSESERGQTLAMFQAFVGSPITQAWWQEVKRFHANDFVNLVDGLGERPEE